LLEGDVLEITVTPGDEAERVLRAAPWIDDLTRDGDRISIPAATQQASEVTRLLADHDLYLSELRPQERSLEQYFLDVTGDAR
jgi:hypothetical protein